MNLLFLLFLALYSTLLLPTPTPALVILDWYFPPLFFCKRGRSCPNSNFFRLDLEGEISFSQFCLLMNFFIIHVVFEILVENVFVCCVLDLLDIVHLILHIASFLKNSFNCL
jgi:hypothetical protein